MQYVSLCYSNHFPRISQTSKKPVKCHFMTCAVFDSILPRGKIALEKKRKMSDNKKTRFLYYHTGLIKFFKMLLNEDRRMRNRAPKVLSGNNTESRLVTNFRAVTWGGGRTSATTQSAQTWSRYCTRLFSNILVRPTLSRTASNAARPD